MHEEHEEHDQHAQARSIARLLRPESVAVIGAGRTERSIGHATARNLLAGRFGGAVHIVNRHPVTIGGHSSVSSVLGIDGPVDLAIVAVPAAQVLEVARDCAAKGVRGLVVLSGGFAELPDGAAMQDELLQLCRSTGMRLVGPNCVGVVNTDAELSLNATFAPVAPVAGRVGVASQSGGVGIELLARAHQLDLGVSSFVSLGNQADVSTNDLLQYWAEDDATDVVVLYLESFGNPTKFARIAGRLAGRKPVVVLKSGRSGAGQRGTRSHTAALADPDAEVDALLRHSGVVRVDTLAELFDVASLLCHQPVPAGARVAVMSNGGGPAIVAADACAAAGLEVPELSPTVQHLLHELVPTGGVTNPIDLIAAASPEVFEEAADIVLDSGEVDCLLVTYVDPTVTDAPEIATALSRVAARGAGTIAGCFLGLEAPPTVVPGPSGHSIPLFPFPEAAARALAHAAQLGRWRRRPAGSALDVVVDVESARARVADQLVAAPDGAWLASEVAAALLSDYGVPMVRTESSFSARAAAETARHLGFPLALKAIAPELVHKSDVGGVCLDLRDEEAVAAAYDDMAARIGPAMQGVDVQPMVEPGVELIVGIHRDPTFGPTVVFGAGGFTAELDEDRVLLVPPLSDVDIDEALRSLRRSPLLFGYRSTPLVDAAALQQVIARVGRLACDIPEIVELDCNPVIASPSGAVVVDVKVRLERAPRRDDPFADDPRRVRS